MLLGLDIKNIALIEKLNIEIAEGMTVLTGETGAGKSIIIDAVNLLLGARGGKTLVRHGEEKAAVQGLFSASDEVNAILDDNGVDTADEVVLSRVLSADGKSVCRINGCMVSQNLLREIGAYLINIHGQQDNQALLTPSKHIDFLDNYAKIDLSEYLEIYNTRKEILKKIDALSQNEQDRVERLDLLRYQVDELMAAELKIGEKDEILAEKTIIENAEKIVGAVSEAYNALYEENSAYDSISIASGSLLRLSGIDGKIDEISSKVTDIQYVIEDIVHELRAVLDSVEYDEQVLNDMESRLDVITKLERKYGGTEESAIAYLEQASAELLTLENADEALAELSTELSKIEAKLEAAADKLTAERSKSAKKLEKEIETALTELDMPKVKFEIMITPSDFTQKGGDFVEFMISPNPGEPMKPLIQIASGGELSRVMLAIKSIINDGIDTMIFDEIDTGVSGSAAQKIANKLSAISQGRQVICVSHQAQLAAKADNHYVIKKQEENGRTITKIRELEKDERISELARIIDGDNLTETAINHAKEMLGL